MSDQTEIEIVEKHAVQAKRHILERVPVKALRVVRDLNGDIDAIMDAFEFDYTGLNITREEVRELVRFCTREGEVDSMASAPSGTEYLIKSADKILRNELARLSEEQVMYKDISALDEGDHCRIKSTGEIVTPHEARRRLEQIIDRTIAIKKALADDVKAKNTGSGQNGANTVNNNFQFNLGEVLTAAVDEIDKRGIVIDAAG